MHTRNTLIMAVVFVLLGGFVYFYEIRGRAEREETERQASRLLPFEAEQVTGLEVTTADGGTVTALKADGVWAITGPVAVAADGESLDTLVDDLYKASHERLIVEGAEDLSPYGLAEPATSVVVTLEDGTTQTVSVGGDTPVGANLYVSPGDGSVYSASRMLRGQFSKGLYDLRDRTLLAFDESAVERTDIRTADFEVSLRVERGIEDDLWFMTAPTDGRADSDTVADLLSSLHTAEAAGFVLDAAPSAEQLQEYGLADPRLQMTLWTSDDTSQRLLVGGASTEPVGYFAMRDGGTAVVVVAADLLEDVPTSLDDLRNKQVLALARENVRTLEVVAADGPTRVERDDAGWRITAPVLLKADASAVSRLLSTLQDLRAAGFAAPGAGPGATSLTVDIGLQTTAQDGGTETVRLTVGGSTRLPPADGEAEEVDARYVSTSVDPTIFLVAAEDLEALEAGAFELRDKTLVQFTQADLTSIDVTAADVSYRFEKDGEVWKMTAPSARELTDDPVSDLLWDLNYLRMAAALDAAGDDAALGLAEPRFRVVASTPDGVVADVAVGAQAPAGDADSGERVYARVAGHEGAFEVQATLAEAIQALLDTIEIE